MHWFTFIVTASQPLVTLTAVSVAGGRKSLSTSPGDVADEKYRVLFRGGAAMTDLVYETSCESRGGSRKRTRKRARVGNGARPGG